MFDYLQRSSSEYWDKFDDIKWEETMAKKKKVVKKKNGVGKTVAKKALSAIAKRKAARKKLMDSF